MHERLAALSTGPGHQFSANDQPKCPHCGEDFDVAANEAWHLYNENDTHEVECTNCDLEFSVNASATWRFSTDEQEDHP